MTLAHCDNCGRDVPGNMKGRPYKHGKCPPAGPRWEPGFVMSTIPDDILASEVGRRNNLKRKTRAGGRPTEPRCACGKMTVRRAASRGHVCEARALTRSEVTEMANQTA